MTKRFALVSGSLVAAVMAACTAAPVDGEALDLDLVSEGGKYDTIDGKALRLILSRGTIVDPIPDPTLEVYLDTMQVWEVGDRLSVHAFNLVLPELYYDRVTGERGYLGHDEWGEEPRTPAPDVLYRLWIESVDDARDAELGFVLRDAYEEFHRGGILTCETASGSHNFFTEVVVDPGRQEISFDDLTVSFEDCGLEARAYTSNGRTWDRFGLGLYPIPLSASGPLEGEHDYELFVDELSVL